MSSEVAGPNGRILEGRVVASKMDKTVVVEVSRVVQHSRYHKYVTRTATFKAHDEINACRENDIVVIQECRPLSKTKRWRVVGRRENGAVVGFGGAS